MILLLAQAANFEPFHCIPVKSSFSFRFLASTGCAVILSSGEVPIQARNFRWLRQHGFLNMGEGTAENVSEFHSQINSMSSVITVHHNDNYFNMILVSLVTPHQNNFKKVSHPQPYKQCNKPHVHNYCTTLIQL